MRVTGIIIIALALAVAQATAIPVPSLEKISVLHAPMQKRQPQPFATAIVKSLGSLASRVKGFFIKKPSAGAAGAGAGVGAGAAGVGAGVGAAGAGAAFINSGVAKKLAAVGAAGVGAGVLYSSTKDPENTAPEFENSLPPFDYSRQYAPQLA
ncbi:hypothetical protein IWQ60_005385 [Tieghemiomyces parasiticus]|uniref:Uncharacterized protein n=1 Tax=Tieghemiomyces parasiticus TaxID=78921 RepID=A0A9W8A731_9FUNG|nr:hypothetical protein IWQ60_005385 [Tieghemiomyces parasiticus]